MYRIVLAKDNIRIIFTVTRSKLPDILIDAVHQNMKIQSLDVE